jgi:hypothetical protein
VEPPVPADLGLLADASLMPDAASARAPMPGERSVRQAGMITAALGLAHAFLIIVSWLLMTTVPRLAGDPATAYLSDVLHRRLVLVGLYLMPFAVIAFIWFEVALRMWITGTHRRANVLLSNVQLVSGVVFVSLLSVAVACTSATAAAVEWVGGPVDPAIAVLLPALGDSVMYVFAIRMAAMFMFTTTSIARSAEILPRWFVWLGYILGLVLLFSATFSTLLAMVFPVWLMVLSVLLLRRARAVPAHIVMPPPVTGTPLGQGPR